MARSKKRTRPADLGQSWASTTFSHDGIDDDADWQDDEFASEDEDQHTPLRAVNTAVPRRPARLSPSPSENLDRSHLTRPSPRPVRRSSREGSTQPPDLVMPTIEDQGPEESWNEANSPTASKTYRRKESSTSRSMSASNATLKSRSSRQPSLGAHTTRRSVDGQQPDRYPQTSKLKRFRDEDEPFTLVPPIVWNILLPPLKYIISVLGMSLQIIRPFLALILLFVVFMSFASHYLGWIPSGITSISTGLGSAKGVACGIPGASFVLDCHNVKPDAANEMQEFRELLNVQHAFQEVLSTSKEVSGLPWHMKQGEMSVRALRELVKFSRLPSRQMLVMELTNFVDLARISAQDLTDLNHMVEKAATSVLFTNKWTLEVLTEARQKQASRGAISKALDNINPLASGMTADKKVLKRYLGHATDLEQQIERVIEKARIAQDNLGKLDSWIDVIGEIVAKDDESLRGAQEELLALLWTKLGGHGQSKRKIEEQLLLLKVVRAYNQRALHHVSLTSMKLLTVKGSLDDLKDRIGAPGNSIDTSDYRLDYYIENIRLGVEQLEGLRKDNLMIKEDVRRREMDGVIQSVDGKGRLIDSDVKTVEARLPGSDL